MGLQYTQWSHTSPLLPQTTNLRLLRLYSYTVSSNYRSTQLQVVENKWERDLGVCSVVVFLTFFFFCLPVEIRVIGSDFPEVKPVIRFLFLLLCGCWQSPEVPPHTHSTTRTLQTLTSPVTPEKTLLIAKQTLCVCVCACKHV